MWTADSVPGLVKELNDLAHSEPVVQRALEDLEDFIDDPIGYGTFDDAEPITLDQYVNPRFMHGRFADVIA